MERAWTFQKPVSGWSAQTLPTARLADPDGGSTTSHGQSVALDALGTTLAVGAPGADVNGHDNAGVVHVYHRTSTAWTYG